MCPDNFDTPAIRVCYGPPQTGRVCASYCTCIGTCLFNRKPKAPEPPKQKPNHQNPGWWRGIAKR